MRECYLIDAVPAARGRLSRSKKGFVGELAHIHPTTLGAILVNAILDRNPGRPPEKIEDLIYSTAIAIKNRPILLLKRENSKMKFFLSHISIRTARNVYWKGIRI